MLTFGTSLLTNVWQAYEATEVGAEDGWGKSDKETNFLFLSVIITALMVTQMLAPPVALARANSAGIELQKALAHHKELLPLALQSTICRPGVRVLGGYLTLSKLLLLVPILCFYVYTVTKALTAGRHS